MVDLDEYRLVVAAGDAKGVVIRCPGAVLVARPTRPGTQAVMAQLLALCGEAADTSQAPEAAARALVRRVAGVLASAEPEDVPDFALLVSSGERLAALVHGATDLIASGEPGEIRLSGAESATWLDRLLPPSLDRIEIGPTGVVPAPANAWPEVPFPLDLRSGVVAGTGAVLLAGGGTFGGRP
ncbi:MAG: FHA domain-containing protein, partial [Frankia sp.]